MKEVDSGKVFVTAILIIVIAVIVFLAVKFLILGGYTIEIDGCEYIRSGYGLAHKGNCKNCKERCVK